MNDTALLRVRAASLRTLCLRLGTLLTATLALTTLACMSIPSFAAAHPRRHSARRPRRCVGSHARIGHAPRREIELATLCLINRQRTRRGLPKVGLSPRLDRSAQGWTNTMVHDHAFSHGSDFGARISAVGFNWSQIGENIADGYRTPASAVKAWMASTGHCQNILNPDYREIGTGFDRGSAMGGYRPGTWTMDFGLLMSQHPLSSNFGPAAACPY